MLDPNLSVHQMHNLFSQEPDKQTLEESYINMKRLENMKKRTMAQIEDSLEPNEVLVD